MEAYLWAFFNFEQNNWAQVLHMVKFAYNNAKNASTDYFSFEFNCGYYLYISYKEDLDPCSKSRTVEDFFFEFQKLIIVC